MGEKIKELRKARGISQWGLSAATGISASVISACERWNLKPGEFTRKRLSDYFGVPESELWPDLVEVAKSDQGEVAGGEK